MPRSAVSAFLADARALDAPLAPSFRALRRVASRLLCSDGRYIADFFAAELQLVVEWYGSQCTPR
jgi:hypothetical protein